MTDKEFIDELAHECALHLRFHQEMWDKATESGKQERAQFFHHGYMSGLNHALHRIDRHKAGTYRGVFNHDQ